MHSHYSKYGYGKGVGGLQTITCMTQISTSA